jgi:hypothetical protein
MLSEALAVWPGQLDRAAARCALASAVGVGGAPLLLGTLADTLGLRPTSLGNLATVLRDQGNLDAARSLYERALNIREARLGTDHPDSVRTGTQLAAVMGALQRRP